MIIADTSGLLAAMDPDELHHSTCRAVIEMETAPLVMSPFVLCELDYLVSRKLDIEAELAMLEDIAAEAYQLAPIDPGDVATALGIVEQYRDLGIGLSDAFIVALANKHRTVDILPLDDRHFRAMLSTNGQPFRLLPADLEQ